MSNELIERLAREEPSAAELRAVLRLAQDSPSGLRWQSHEALLAAGRNRAYCSRWADQVAGRLCGRYWRVHVGAEWAAHRLVHILAIGPIPAGFQVDHIDRNSFNNSPSNLRAVPPHQNCWNIGAHRRNKLGLVGVYWQASANSFRAEIMVRGKKHKLGCFRTAEAASAAYQQAKSELHAAAFPTPKD